MITMKWTGFAWLFMSGLSLGQALGLSSPEQSQWLFPVHLILTVVAFANFAVRLHYAKQSPEQ